MGKQARSPESRMEHTIGTMAIGESAWMLPWAMWADGDGLLWINGKYRAAQNPSGTIDTRVIRCKDGYVVDISASDHTYQPTDSDPFMGGADTLPVVELKGA